MRGSGFVLGVLLAFLVVVSVALPSSAVAPPNAFTKPVVIGFKAGDDWEPDIAVDGQGHVYVIWAHYGGVPGCPTCSSPAAMIQISQDGGLHWGRATPLNRHPLYGADSFQVDVQVKVNAHGTVFVAYLDGNDTVVQRSDDFGRHFSAPIAANAVVGPGETDKVGLAVQGNDVYVSFSIDQRFFVVSSHDGGHTFSGAEMHVKGEQNAFTLTSGGVIDSQGTVYFTWVSVHEHGTRLSPQDLFLTKSSDGGRHWSTIFLERGLPEGPNCDVYQCGWDYLGPQVVVTVDAADRVYVAYNTGVRQGAAPSVWFRTSGDQGRTWSQRVVLQGDHTDAAHVFPAIVAGKAGHVYVAWQDNRTGLFNTWFRSSSDGGTSWTQDVRVSRFAPGFDYKEPTGYNFTYGDYFGIAWDGMHVHLVWGEGPDWVGPGNVWYARNT
jgi:hypothetical protein